MLVGLMVILHLARRRSLDPDQMWNVSAIAVFSGIFGAKVLYVINEWHSHFSKAPGDIFSIETMQSGGVFSGGLVIALLCCWWYLRAHRIPFLAACDIFAPGLAIGHAIGRLGCFSAGCCYGKETHVAWAVTFTNPMARDITGTPLNVPLHPTQLYEFAAELANFVVLFWLARRKRFEGQVIGLYLFLYGIERFLIEFYRGDEGRGHLFGNMLTGTQGIAIALILCGGLLWALRIPLRQTATAPAKR